jgi:hypothetical protein
MAPLQSAADEHAFAQTCPSAVVTQVPSSHGLDAQETVHILVVLDFG